MKHERAYSISVRDAAIGDIDERFLSFTIDISCVIGGRWWGDTKGLKEGLSQDRVPPLDFKDPTLARRAAQLSPAMLRVGGTEADRLHYEFGRGEILPREAMGVTGAPTLNKKKWLEICSFARRVGFGLLFTVGAGPDNRDAWGDWDERDATLLFDYCARKKIRVDAWEFGNEVNAFPFIYGVARRVSARRYSADFARFAALVGRLQPEALAVGPASAVWPVIGEPNPLIPKLCRSTAASAMGALSFHYYPQQSSRGRVAVRRAREGTLLTVRRMDSIRGRIRAIRKSRDAGAAKGKPIWVTEIGHALYGGQRGLSDTWISMPWWLDQLSLLAHDGVAAVFRQSLVGGDYGLLDPKTFAPRPDYHVSFLWKRLIGSRVHAPPEISGKDPKIRVWAMSGKKESIWVIAINLDRKKPLTITLDRRIRRQLVLEPDYGHPSGSIVLNGILVDTDLEDGWGTKEIKRKYGLTKRWKTEEEGQTVAQKTDFSARTLKLAPLACAFVEVLPREPALATPVNGGGEHHPEGNENDAQNGTQSHIDNTGGKIADAE